MADTNVNTLCVDNYGFLSLRTEKNATPWSKTRLKELFDGLEIKSDKGGRQYTDRVHMQSSPDGLTLSDSIRIRFWQY